MQTYQNSHKNIITAHFSFGHTVIHITIYIYTYIYVKLCEHRRSYPSKSKTNNNKTKFQEHKKYAAVMYTTRV